MDYINFLGPSEADSYFYLLLSKYHDLEERSLLNFYVKNVIIEVLDCPARELGYLGWGRELNNI